ncbi:MAG TPA: hypothetical protein VKZ63_08875 [Kofleriaceae bacterium]|nr:hypothetical protein [Kofleriaceae bacterium]
MRATSVLVLLLAGACEKAGDSTKIEGSGAMTDQERALFAHVPASASVVFGGNYRDLMEYWKTSPLKTLTEAAMAAGGQPSGMRDYMNCWIEQESGSHLVGALEFRKETVGLVMLIRGVTEKTLTTCAEKGGFGVERDADGKYIELQGLADGRGGTANAGYYFVAPDTAYFAMEMPVGLGSAAALPPASRADLEARLARARSAPASGSAQVQALVAAADRSKPIWMSGTAAGTPLAAKVGKGSGWLDVDKDSLTLAFSIELMEEGAASRAVAQFGELKKQVGMLPPDLKQAAEALLADATLTSSGKTLSGRFKLTNEVLSKLMPAIGSAMGGGL